MLTQDTVKRAIEGDEDSFLALINEKKGSMYRIAYSYVKNKHDALDIVQEAVYKAYISVAKLKNPENFNTWLIRIVINCAVDYLRKTKKIIYLEQENLEKAEENKNIEQNMDLHAAIDNLDTKHKAVIILRYFEDMTLQDIAQVLEWPVNTVKTYLYRALKQLKIKLEEVELSG